MVTVLQLTVLPCSFSPAHISSFLFVLHLVCVALRHCSFSADNSRNESMGWVYQKGNGGGGGSGCKEQVQSLYSLHLLKGAQSVPLLPRFTHHCLPQDPGPETGVLSLLLRGQLFHRASFLTKIRGEKKKKKKKKAFISVHLIVSVSHSSRLDPECDLEVLVHDVADADCGDDLHEVGGQAPVQADGPFCAHDVSEEPRHGHLRTALLSG